MSVCMCLRACALCVSVPVICAHMAENPRNMAATQSVLPIATRHLTLYTVNPDSLAGPNWAWWKSMEMEEG